MNQATTNQASCVMTMHPVVACRGDAGFFDDLTTCTMIHLCLDNDQRQAKFHDRLPELLA